MRGNRRIAPHAGVRRFGVLADLHAVGEELDLGYAAIAVGGGGGECDLGRREEVHTVRRRGQFDHRREVVDDDRNSLEIHLEPDIRTVGGVLMHFHGEDIHAIDEQRWIHGKGGNCRTVIPGVLRQGRRRHGASRHVEPGQFGAVKVDHCAVVALDVQVYARKTGGVAGDDRLPVIRRDEFGSVTGAEGIRGRRRTTTGITVAQRRRATRPRRIIEARRHPCRALIGTVIEIFPDRAVRHEGGRYADVHRLRRVTCAVLRNAYCRKPMRTAHDLRPRSAVGRRVALRELHAVHEELHLRDRAARQIAPGRDSDGSAVQIHRVLERREQSHADVLHEHAGRRRFHRITEAVDGRDIDGVRSRRNILSHRTERLRVVRGEKNRRGEWTSSTVKIHARGRRIGEIWGESNRNRDWFAGSEDHSVR